MIRKTILLIIVLGLIVGIIWVLFLRPQNNPLSNPLGSKQMPQAQPSETFIEYTDPAGFKFTYPDNLSIIKNEIEDTSSYADIQLNSNTVSGSLNLKITDSKYKTLDEWLNLNKDAVVEGPKDVKLGNLKAIEIKTSDRLYLAALDQGVLFTIEVPRIEEDFWMKVYQKILEEFSFSNPSENTASQEISSYNDITFEGEEVVE